MAVLKKKFGAEDIGAELLPIMTSGLYRDPLDTLREYVQNAIDANAKNIEIKISHDLVSIRDDGSGMTRDEAERAIRLGMSEKNPVGDVGFRGIGVYSAFNICNKLEIHTRAIDGHASILIFDFNKIRDCLKEEEERRMNGDPSLLNLVELLTNSVWVEGTEEFPLEGSGTFVMMVGLKGEVLERLTDFNIVSEYLESVVPLPFEESFSHKKEIEERFQSEDYRVVNLKLEVSDHSKRLYRPYNDNIFTHRRGIGPKFFELKNELGTGRLGFAWVFVNDARKYLPLKKLRGILIKKFGFSVGDRNYFAKYFNLAVFNNRTTGEVIITDKELLPNAARTEFEPGPIRDSLYYSFSRLAQDISNWANIIQTELKAREELDKITPEVFRIVKELQKSERDIPRLLSFNNSLSDFSNRLKNYKTTLKKLDEKKYDGTLRALEEAKTQITEILKSQQRAKGRRSRILRAKKIQISEPTREELVYVDDKPKSLLEVLQLMDIEINESIINLLEYLDKEVLREILEEEEYINTLDNIRAYLEEIL